MRKENARLKELVAETLLENRVVVGLRVADPQAGLKAYRGDLALRFFPQVKAARVPDSAIETPWDGIPENLIPRWDTPLRYPGSS